MSDGGNYALKGQKVYLHENAYALSGRCTRSPFTQGDALSYVLIALSGRLWQDLRNLNKVFANQDLTISPRFAFGGRISVFELELFATYD